MASPSTTQMEDYVIHALCQSCHWQRTTVPEIRARDPSAVSPATISGSDREKCRFRRRHFQDESFSTTENSHVAE